MANDERQSEQFIREVDEELRRAQLKALWDRFAPLIIGVCVLVVLITAGYRGWIWWQERQAAQAGDRFMAALEEIESGDRGEGRGGARGDRRGGAGPAMPRWRGCALPARRRRRATKPEAIAAYDAVAATTRACRSRCATSARIRAALLALDTGDLAGAKQRADAARHRRQSLAPCGARGDRDGRLPERRTAGGARRLSPRSSRMRRRRTDLWLRSGHDGVADRRPARRAWHRARGDCRRRMQPRPRTPELPASEAPRSQILRLGRRPSRPRRRRLRRRLRSRRAGSCAARGAAPATPQPQALIPPQWRGSAHQHDAIRTLPFVLTVVTAGRPARRLQHDQQPQSVQEEREDMLPGDRAAALPQAANQVTGGTPSIGGATAMADWSQPGGNAANAPGNVSLDGTSGAAAWRVRAVEKASKRNVRPVRASARLWRAHLRLRHQRDGDRRCRRAAAGHGRSRCARRTRREPRDGRRHRRLRQRDLSPRPAIGELVALDAATGNRIWTFKMSAPAHSAPTAAGGKVFVVSATNVLHAVNQSTGPRPGSIRASRRPPACSPRPARRFAATSSSCPTPPAR